MAKALPLRRAFVDRGPQQSVGFGRVVGGVRSPPAPTRRSKGRYASSARLASATNSVARSAGAVGDPGEPSGGPRGAERLRPPRRGHPAIARGRGPRRRARREAATSGCLLRRRPRTGASIGGCRVLDRGRGRPSAGERGRARPPRRARPRTADRCLSIASTTTSPRRGVLPTPGLRRGSTRWPLGRCRRPGRSESGRRRVRRPSSAVPRARLARRNRPHGGHASLRSRRRQPAGRARTGGWSRAGRSESRRLDPRRPSSGPPVARGRRASRSRRIPAHRRRPRRPRASSRPRRPTVVGADAGPPRPAGPSSSRPSPGASAGGARRCAGHP